MPKKLKITLILIIIIVTVSLTSICGYDYIKNERLQSKMDSVITDDYRNEGISVSVHYDSFLNFDTLVYDLQDVAGDKSKVDVFRVFLQFADRVKNHEFETIKLAFRGKTKFLLSGEDFQTIGQDYSCQNPVYTIRTFPEKLSYPDGSKAFPTWTGGLLGATAEQMEDFNEFCDQWFLNDLLGIS